jgi:hypothetical protein
MAGEAGCSGGPAVCLRFVVIQRHRGCSHRPGVFVLAYDLLWGDSLTKAEYEWLREIVDWFEKNLPLPDRSRLDPGAIFWFKAGGDRSVKRIWELVEFLKDCGYHVELIKTQRPGRVCYEDEHQVAATPFRGQSF